jgi:hypothetical protein
VALQSHTGVMSDRATAAAAAVAGPAPLAQLLFVGTLARQKLAMNEAQSLMEGLAQALAVTWPGLLVVLVVSAIGAVAAYRRQKRFGLPNAAGWAVFAFLFGVPGWLAYRFHRPWPVLEDCPACDEPAPRDRELCTECGAQFPAPEPKGIEVFA